MPAVVKGCHCHQCQSIRVRRQTTIKRFSRSFRRKTKLALKAGAEPPVAFGFGWPG